MEKEIALITGASSGMGLEYAKNLASRGYDLILVAKPKENLHEVSKKIKNTKIYLEELDLTKQENVEFLYKKYQEKNITILINNAGFGNYGSFIENSLEKDLAMIDLNVKALHSLSYYFAKFFSNKNKGLIINVASIAAFVPGPYMATYYATKTYVRKLTETINYEFKINKKNVRAITICPGPIRTNFWKVSSNIEGENTKTFNKTFLPSFEASKFVNKVMKKVFKKKRKDIFFVGWIFKLFPLFERIAPRSLKMKLAKKFNESQKPINFKKGSGEEI